MAFPTLVSERERERQKDWVASSRLEGKCYEFPITCQFCMAARAPSLAKVLIPIGIRSVVGSGKSIRSVVGSGKRGMHIRTHIPLLCSAPAP